MTDAKFPEGRKLLALYPVLLFYLSLAWIVLIGFQQGVAPTGVVSESVPGGKAPPVPSSNPHANVRFMVTL